MGHQSPFSPYSGNSVLTDKLVGNAYPVVRAVHDKLDEIAYLAQNTGAILEAGTAALNTVEGVAAAAALLNELGPRIDTVEVDTSALGVIIDNLGESYGSDNIGYRGAAPFAVTSTVGLKNQEIVSVKDFGAKGDGSTDDSYAISLALMYAVSVAPCKLVFPSARYKCLSTLGTYIGSDIELDLQGSILDFTALSLSDYGPLLSFQGVYSSLATITALATAGDTIVSVNSTAFAVGDMVRIYSNGVWDATRTSTRIGEISFVKAIPDGASIQLTTELQTGYTTEHAATIQKLIPAKNITIRNGTIIGPTGNDQLVGLDIRIGVTCLLDNVKSYDIDKIHFRLIDCAFSKVINCHLEQSNHVSQAYGVSFVDACQDCSAVNNSFVDVRHSLSTNNNASTSWGIVRRILFSTNIVSDSALALGLTGGDAIDTHAGAEEISIIGNIVNSSSGYGINFEARTGLISGNTIKRTSSGGININPRADSASTVTLTNNTLLGIGNAAAEYGILVIVQTSDMSNCVISGNRIVSFAQPIRINGVWPYRVYRPSVTGNCAQLSSSSSVSTGIELMCCDGASISGNAVTSKSVGILLEDCVRAAVSGNTVELIGTSGSSGYGIRVQGTSTGNSVSGNSLIYSTTGIATTVGVSLQPTTVTYSGIWSNVARNFDTNVSTSTGVGNVAANNI